MVTVPLGVAVAAIKTDKSKALAAFTSAALGLPGLQSYAAIPAANIAGNVSYGYYQESASRMQVSVYHADSILPLTDRLELAFSLDRDTYSGATPVFSLPETLTLLPASEYGTGAEVYKDLVSAASGVLGADTITFRGGLDTFKKVANLRDQFAIEIADTVDYRRNTIELENIALASSRTNSYTGLKSDVTVDYYEDLRLIHPSLPTLELDYDQDKALLEQQKQNEIAQNQKPNSIEFSTTVNFGTGTTILPDGAYFGKANTPPLAGGNCTSGDCVVQNGMIIGTISDPTQQGAHLHRGGSSANRQINHHNDAGGIYIRSVDSSAFSLNSMKINASYDEEANPFTPGQPGYDANQHFWKVLGFNSAVNTNLADNDKTGNCAEYSTCTAYQTFANGFNGTLSLNSAFQNIKAAWIHFANFNNVGKIPNDMAFNILVDDINVSPSVIWVAWNADQDSFRAALDAQYDALIAARTALKDQNILSLNLDNDAIAAYGDAKTRRDTLIANLTQSYNNEIALLEQDRQAALADLPNLQNQLRYNALVARYAAILNTITPTNTPALERFAMQPQETRSMPKFTTNYYLADSTLSFSGGYSDEPDFLSNFGSVNINHEFNDKLTTVSFGYGKTSNQINRSTPHTAAGGHNHDYASPNYPDLNENSQFDNFTLGLSQVLGKNTLFQSTLNYTHQRGYLSNPYKYVYVRGEITAEEYAEIENTIGDPDRSANLDWNGITRLEMVGIELFRDSRPKQRNLWSWSNRINQHLPSLNATVHLDYRFFTDDWSVNSHTMEVKWFQSLANGWTVTPSLRYYSQSQADFFAPYFLAPREDGFYSSDFRLSAFGTLGGGLTVTKEFARGIKLETGFEYTAHAGNLKIGGGGVGNYADFDYFMAHANLSVDLSARSLAFLGGGSGDHEHHHHQHGAALPAGVMFGHMMNQSDAIMVGYRFMYGVQSGSMRQGDGFVDDLTLVNNACEGYAAGCFYKPTKMHMQMHMLDLMYAPTDWLNLMVMPQLMSMDMSMSNPLRQPTLTEQDSGHGGSHHTSNDIGDTIVTALVKVVDNGTHRAHAGIGVSAPTGSIDAQLSPPQLVSSSGTKVDASSLNLQDYGMQLGSGTWDFKPSLTYNGQLADWGWGLQFSGTKRLEYNKYGYAFGDQIQASGWGSYAIFDWLSATIRGVYTWQDHIQGRSKLTLDATSPVDFPSNYGGRFWDVGLGLNTSFRDGKFAGHSLAVEWLQPVHSDFNGYQLDRDGALTATWSYSF